MITNRDRDVVEWIARTGAVEPSQVMYLFEMGRTVAYRRLAALHTAGLLERARLLHGQPAISSRPAPGCGWSAWSTWA